MQLFCVLVFVTVYMCITEWPGAHADGTDWETFQSYRVAIREV